MAATVSVIEDDFVRIQGPDPHPFDFGSVDEFVRFVDRYGYGTGQQLLAATFRTFVDLAHSQQWKMPKGLVISFDTCIPRSVGLAGSSALVISLLRCLLDVCGQRLDDYLLPALALSAEVDQLGITGGLQDRVVQTYGGLVAMDFGSLATDARTGLVHGHYEQLDPDSLPRLFIAYSHASAEPSDTYHKVLRSRFAAGDPMTVAGLHELAGLVTRGKAALRWGGDGLGSLMTRNMEIRSTLAPVSEGQLVLVKGAQECGLAATFTGSGGAIVGVFKEETDLDRLAHRLDGHEAVVQEIQPFSHSR